MEKIIGIDFGEVRIGVAIGDTELRVAVPLKTIDVKKADPIESLKGLVKEHNVSKIVIGLPIGLSGSESRLSKLAREFAERVKKETGVEAVLVDERFTSALAERSIRMMGKKPSRHKKKVDMMAAALILQSYLDSLR